MPKRDVLLLEKKGSPWNEYLKEFFEDTHVRLNHMEDSAAASISLTRHPPAFVFLNPQCINETLVRKIEITKRSLPHLRVVAIVEEPKASNDLFDASFITLPEAVEFQTQIVELLVLPEVIHIVVVDDEVEIGNLVKNFFERRTNPSFKVEYLEDGRKALDYIERERPHVVITDVKMPLMDGRDLYRNIVQERKIDIPVIVFFDAISGDEVTQLYQVGRPAIVEKGDCLSAMPQMMNLCKKLAFFG